MRFLVGLSVLFFSQMVFAEAVLHSHGGRTHSHPLPTQGIAHQHQGGARGVPANQGGGITGQVRYGNEALQRPPSGSIRSQSGNPSPNRVGEVILGVPVNQRPTIAIKPVPPSNSNIQYRGDTRCRWGDRDCNRCAPNVRQQFQRAAAGQLRWRSKPWRFTWRKNYPPQNKTPRDIFDGDAAYALGIPNKHVQGFVRTNSKRFPYAGTHSHKSKGGIFLVRQNPEGKKYLDFLKTARSKHPSGMQAFGQYVVYGERGGLLQLQDLTKPAQNPISLALPRQPAANFGGGVAMARLKKDRYILVTTGPGGQDQRPRFNRFYQMTGRGGQPNQIRFMNQSKVQIASGWPHKAAFAENLSLITECGSGDIYAIHTTGDQDGINAITGNGYWRLSKLTERSRQLSFQPVQVFTQRQNMKSCNMRAAATVAVNPQGRLEFYCHGYARDPKRTVLGVLGSSGKNNDRFHFKVGTLQ